MKFSIAEIAGRQYLVKPGQSFEVDKLSDETKTFTVDKVLAIVDDNKMQLGRPYLKKKLDFEVVKQLKKPKVRVAVYKPKANERRVKGQRRQVSVVQLVTQK